VLDGGFGSAILESLSEAGLIDVQVRRIGINNEFVEHGSQSILMAKFNLDESGIYKVCKTCIQSSSKNENKWVSTLKRGLTKTLTFKGL
jgi:1-deoxy-D-xylulose-5-phosphate synthase